ncbi:hypothetical protein ACLOJK_011327 [Asimina triloba]
MTGRCRWTDQISRSTVAGQWVLTLSESMGFAARGGEDDNEFFREPLSPATHQTLNPADPEPNRSGRPTTDALFSSADGHTQPPICRGSSSAAPASMPICRERRRLHQGIFPTSSGRKFDFYSLSI